MAACGDFVATPPAALQPGIYPPLADGNLIAATMWPRGGSLSHHLIVPLAQ